MERTKCKQVGAKAGAGTLSEKWGKKERSLKGCQRTQLEYSKRRKQNTDLIELKKSMLSYFWYIHMHVAYCYVFYSLTMVKSFKIIPNCCKADYTQVFWPIEVGVLETLLSVAPGEFARHTLKCILFMCSSQVTLAGWTTSRSLSMTCSLDQILVTPAFESGSTSLLKMSRNPRQVMLNQTVCQL